VSDVGLGGVLFALVMVVVLVALVLVVASAVRRGPADEPAPLEPMTAEQLLPPEPRTVEERLAEIDALHASGAITDSERDEARARIITSM
jgi:hypothetical protein